MDKLEIKVKDGEPVINQELKDKHPYMEWQLQNVLGYKPQFDSKVVHKKIFRFEAFSLG